MPLLAGSSFGDSRGVPLVTWLSALGAIVGVSLLEQSGAAPGMGDVWSLLSAIFFGVQVRHPIHMLVSAPAGLAMVSMPSPRACPPPLLTCPSVLLT